jgi:outer membrane protein assembly factor BamB
MVVMRVPRWMLVGPGQTIREGVATFQVAFAHLPRVVLFACLLACLLTGAASTGVAHGEPAWTTYHRDPERSGDDPDATEPIAPVLAWHTPSLGAPIWGQPLVLGSHVYAATVGDEIYELNATTGAVEWQQSAGTPVPSEELPCGDITPTVGIVGTPVIDTSTGTIYAVADTWNASTHEAQHVLKGYRLSDGAQVLSVPVDPPGTQPKDLLQRTALNLDGGDLIFGFGGNDGDCADYRGTVVAAPLDGDQPRFWQVPIALPATSGGAVWAPSGPAVDSAGNVYATTGNPDPPEGHGVETYDYSDSVVKLNLTHDFVADPLTEQGPPLGFFEPPNWEEESNNDLDLSSSGAELLPGGLLFQAGKDGVGYLIDEATMESDAPAVYSHEVCAKHGSFGGDAYAKDVIYIACTNGTQALAYDESARTFTPMWQGPSDAFGPPIVSGGLVWVVATGGFHGGGETLYGLDPSTGAPTYTETLPSPVTDHFASPSAAGGRLFVSTGCSVTAYQISKSPYGGSDSPGEGPTVAECTPGTPRGEEGTGRTPGNEDTDTASGASTSGSSSSTAPSASPTTHASTALPSTPLLLHTQLRTTSNGRVQVALRCTAISEPCQGTVTLRWEFAVTNGPVTDARGRHRVRRVIFTTLARAGFGPMHGDFTVTLHLDRSAGADLRRHHDHLALQVVIASPGGRTRRVAAVLR